MIIYITLFIAFLSIQSSYAAILAAGSLQSCINNGNTTDSLECSKKMVVSLSLENNKLYQTDSLQFTVNCINSPTGQCPCPCIYSEDPSCLCRDLQQSISISITKTPVYALYPLSQPRMFNGRPYEEYITTGLGGSGGRSCSDSQYDAQPTCGRAQIPDINTGAMQDVPDSQGFCCVCPQFGGDPIPRGFRRCNWAVTWIGGGTPGSAHCLRYDDNWWYRGYKIGTYQLEFDIQVQINTTTTNNSTSNTNTTNTTSSTVSPFNNEVLNVNPSRTFLTNTNKSVAIRLLGDLDSYKQIQILDGQWLLIPVQPGLQPNEIFTANLDMWVILPSDMVSTTGACDHIGVDYTAFRYQTNACSRPIGSCLSNQIYDLGEADTARIAAGLEPLYNITRFGGGWSNNRQIAAATAGGGLSLRLPLKGIRTSLVTLEVSADQLQYVINRAPAKIISSQVCTYDGVVCGGFQAIAGKGFLHVEVKNTGVVAADYRASVTSCSDGVLPVVEQFSSILPGSSYNFTFDLMMETDLEGNRTCTVIITDSTGLIADSTLVNFYTNATVYEPPPDQSNLGNKPTNPGDQPTFFSCRNTCPNIFNFKCLLLNACWKRLTLALATTALIASSITVLWMALRHGWVKRCARFLGCCPSKVSRSFHQKREDMSPMYHGRYNSMYNNNNNTNGSSGTDGLYGSTTEYSTNYSNSNIDNNNNSTTPPQLQRMHAFHYRTH